MRWEHFGYQPHHYEPVHLMAGEEFEVKIDTKFGNADLLPSDYSFVIWADHEADAITNHEGLKSRAFPNFEPKDDTCIYGLNDQLITC